jgi:glutamate/tyrosine decarboxylase-like PLP-dependent enzyme
MDEHTFPSGLSEAAFQERLSELERAALIDDAATNLFLEGPLLSGSDALPWADRVAEIALDVYRRFGHITNFTFGSAFSSMQAELVSWITALMGGAPLARGVVTSGGSESNFLGLLSAYAGAGRRGSVVMPAHAHYSWPKACAIFGLEPIVVHPRDPERCWEVSVADIGAAVRDDTIAVVMTAGTMPFGTIDPIEEVAQITGDRGIHLHVDACIGGFVLPFLRAGGDESIPPWDFAVPGVCSISADLHKHGFAPLPASMVLVRDDELLERIRTLCPPHGTLTGSRPASSLAAAWTLRTLLGTEGYVAAARRSIEIRDAFSAEVERIEGLRVVPGSMVPLFSIWSQTHDLRPVYDRLRAEGWQLIHKDRPSPVTILVWVVPQNDGMAGAFGQALALAMADAPSTTSGPGTPGTTEEAYGGLS